MTNQNHNKTKRMLITGATGGMGRASAVLAAKEGYQLILADLSAEKLAALAQECAEAGATVECQVLDVTKASDIENLCAVAKNGGIDAIIHTVGISPTMAGWEKIIEVDLISTAKFLETIRPDLNVGCGVVCITSMSAYLAPPNPELENLLVTPLAPGLMEQLRTPAFEVIQNSGMAYSYSKRALKDWVAINALPWGREGKRLVSIAPGLIDTEMGLQENAAHQEGFNAMMKMAAIDRRGQADDIANAALFLASDKASYICGIDILVDGGIIGTMTQARRRQG